MNIRLLRGTLLVSRDEPETFKDIGDGKKLYFPDDMGHRDGGGENSWAASNRIQPKGLCHKHEPSEFWDEIDLSGKRVYFEKWSERTFEYGGRTFCILDERAIQAFEEIEDEPEEHRG